MTGVPWLLAWRSLCDRPWRAALLLLGYGMGVAVMIALLSVGDALLSEARDPNLAAGGDLVLLPRGVDPAVLKVNGVTGLFFTIPHAGFVTREVLLGPRFGREIAAAAPELHGRQVYLRVRGQTVLAAASAGIPSLDQAVRVPEAVPGATDSAADLAWLDPASTARFNRIDHFHRPPPGDRAAWAEWDYVNFVDPSTGTYGYLTLLAGGEGRGAVLFRLRRPGHQVEDLAIPAPIRPGDLSTTTAAQRVGPARVWVESGTYRLVIASPRLHADLRLTPDPGLYLPAGETGEGAGLSGYVVPVVRGRLTGTIRTADAALGLTGVPAYHDHNWGTWRGVTWEWGEASSAEGAMLYGALHEAGQTGAGQRPAVLVLWGRSGAGRGGVIGVLPIRRVSYAGWHAGPALRGHPVRVPREILVTAADGRDTVRVRVRVRDALASLPAAPASARAPREATRAFLQLRGEAEVQGTVGGRPVAWRGRDASETFVPVPAGSRRAHVHGLREAEPARERR